MQQIVCHIQVRGPGENCTWKEIRKRCYFWFLEHYCSLKVAYSVEMDSPPTGSLMKRADVIDTDEEARKGRGANRTYYFRKYDDMKVPNAPNLG